MFFVFHTMLCKLERLRFLKGPAEMSSARVYERFWSQFFFWFVSSSNYMCFVCLSMHVRILTSSEQGLAHTTAVRCLLSPRSCHGDSSGPSPKGRRSQTEQIHTPPGEERKSDQMTQVVRNHKKKALWGI